MIDLIMLMSALTYSISIAIGAAGITIIYNATKTFNFVHSSMVGWGCYTVFALTYILSGLPHQYLPIAFFISGAIGILTYVAVNRRLIMAKASDINLMMSTLGMDLIMFAFLNIFADYLMYGRKIPIAKRFVLRIRDPEIYIAGLNLRLTWVIAPVALIVVIILLYLVLSRTKLGIAMRATVENPELSQLQGINPDYVYIISWFIGGGLAGLSGGLISMVLEGRPTIGMETVITFFAGAIVGGLHSFYGGFLGGLLVGFSEYVIPSILSPFIGGWIYSYKPIIPLAIMVTTLLIQPSGLGILIEKR